MLGSPEIAMSFAVILGLLICMEKNESQVGT